MATARMNDTSRKHLTSNCFNHIVLKIWIADGLTFGGGLPSANSIRRSCVLRGGNPISSSKTSTSSVKNLANQTNSQISGRSNVTSVWTEDPCIIQEK